MRLSKTLYCLQKEEEEKKRKKKIFFLNSDIHIL